MAAHNSGGFIAQAIASVQAQTRGDWELIVIDDASDDGTPDTVAALADVDPRIRLIALEHNFGAPMDRVTSESGRPRALGGDPGRRRRLAPAEAGPAAERPRHDGCGLRQRRAHRLRRRHLAGVHLVARARVKRISCSTRWSTPRRRPRPPWWSTATCCCATFNEDPPTRRARTWTASCTAMRSSATASGHASLLGYRITGDQQISGRKLTMMRRHAHVLGNAARPPAWFQAGRLGSVHRGRTSARPSTTGRCADGCSDARGLLRRQLVAAEEVPHEVRGRDRHGGAAQVLLDVGSAVIAEPGQVWPPPSIS